MEKSSDHNLIIAVDDLHPEQRWGVKGDQSIKYMKQLYDDYGCKFTFFCPSNYHKKYPLNKFKDWVSYWIDQEWVELAAHGNYHLCDNPAAYGECEFFEIQTEDEGRKRIDDCLSMWNDAGYVPKGWRNPGWLINHILVPVISEKFEWVAAHENDMHNYKTKKYVGADGIHQSEGIKLWNSNFMFQSHIAGDHNDNCWTRENYIHFRGMLEYLSKNYNISYKTISKL